MKYKDISKEDAKKCCKHHHKNCNICPLERTWVDNTGKLHHLLCWYVLMNLYSPEDLLNALLEMEYLELKDEELSKPNEWTKYLQESQE